MKLPAFLRLVLAVRSSAAHRRGRQAAARNWRAYDFVSRRIAARAAMRRLGVSSANGDPLRFASFGLPVVADGVRRPSRSARRNPGRARLGRGPPARRPMDSQRSGRLSLSAPRPRRAIAPTPCPLKTPSLPSLRPQGRCHPVIGLWKVALRDALRQALVVEGLRKVDTWTGRYRLAPSLGRLSRWIRFTYICPASAEAERLAAIEDRS